MKKIYSTPFQKVVDLELESLIADSGLDAINARGNGVQLTKGETDWDSWGDDESCSSSSRNGIWGSNW